MSCTHFLQGVIRRTVEARKVSFEKSGAGFCFVVKDSICVNLCWNHKTQFNFLILGQLCLKKLVCLDEVPSLQPVSHVYILSQTSIFPRAWGAHCPHIRLRASQQLQCLYLLCSFFVSTWIASEAFLGQSPHLSNPPHMDECPEWTVIWRSWDSVQS